MPLFGTVIDSVARAKAEAALALARKPPLTYAMKSRSSGNVTTPYSGTTFGDFDTSLDLVVAAVPGDVLDVGINCQAGDNQVSPIEWNFETLVSGAAVSRAAGALGASTSIGSWSIRGNDYWGQSASIRYLVQAADVSNGNVQLRLKVRTNDQGGSGRVVFAMATVPFFWDARNLGTPG